ncbi:MAG: PQQ-dependent dehydrogenase, methanol/ethanol family [Woeseia sp.]
MNKNASNLLTLAAFFAISACEKETGQEAAEPWDAPRVTSERLLAAAGDTSNWLTHGRTYDEQRFSPLDTLDSGNVADLGLDWFFDIPTNRGVEATPLVIDGVMYVTGSWSTVFALDAGTGEQIWAYDPEVPKIRGKDACCDVVNRGVAAWGDKVYVGTLDGYLVALDAANGSVAWRVSTIDRDQPYTITGAPRVIKGNVVIGNGGAEFGVRGYVTAYDAETGNRNWRFYTVPGNPAEGFENEAMAMAAETWTGEWWQYGGGGTVWDSMAYDPELDLLYIGVGNGSPWNRQIRSPGGGDNLFLSSIVALKPDTGEYVWHYQTTPGETWDFTATQHIILADLEIDGILRRVAMQAPKNGFFYVLDRENGALISAQNYVPVTWATGIDAGTGRPVETPGARYTDGPSPLLPGSLGGHNWQPMAFSPDTGLVYIPAQQIPGVYGTMKDFEFIAGQWNTGIDLLLADMPEDPVELIKVAGMLRGHLSAWDPVSQKEVWRYQHAGPWNGGVLATAGNLVFQGNIIGEFVAYAADTGERLWAFPTQTGITAGPVTFEIGDRQYVSVAVGWGTAMGMLGGPTALALQMKNRSRVLTFRLGASGRLPELPAAPPPPAPDVPEQTASAASVRQGHRVFANRCMVCHGFSAVSGGLTPDLRYSDKRVFAEWDAIVLGGSQSSTGMPGFAGVVTLEQSQAIKAYIIDRAQSLR